MLVDPAAAHTANGVRPAARSARTAVTRVVGASRHDWSVGSTRTWDGRRPMTRAVRASDEWAWSETYRTASSDGPPATSRATSRPVRLAVDPPF